MAKRVIKPTTKKASAAKRTTKKPTTVNKSPTKGVKPTTVTTFAEAAKAKEPIKKTKASKKALNHVRISETASKDEFSIMWDKVKNGELKWGYYAIDGNVGYHYYLVLKKK
jgi:hypothetical protein